MTATWTLLAVLAALRGSESRCSSTSYYKSCWIRRFPGVFIDTEESVRRGAQLLKVYLEETALQCSRTCCLTRNFSCNLAIFHYDTSQHNCFHLHCPTLESCILSQRGNVVLYNVTKGVDPDLLVFGKYFTSNVRVLPHLFTRVNASEQLPPDKRQFLYPPQGGTFALTHAPTRRSWTTVRRSVSTVTPRSPSPPPGDLWIPPSSTVASEVQSSSATQTSPATPSPTTAPASTSAHLLTNHTVGGLSGVRPEAGSHGPGMTSGWDATTRTLLVTVILTMGVTLSCCCSFLLVVRWRGQRRRAGRYRTSRRGEPGSMRLIKYVLVRENP
ncbi:MANSC domain-containing protein 4-like [Synchiropus splendidus]|uniref:MANSC domain-containing protein 4-like n=1 Tax=Synchiropus splendidus TaxID=270530 RepID=UPI00237E4FED|nr:MANSC domain-containing protein 4-like [Synchiropus splendidus]